MMLAASPFYSQPAYMHTPARPSPLSERPANVLFRFTMTSQNTKAPVPQRTHKPNPMIQSRDTVSQRRRDMFFRRVQKDRDEKKWNARGEQIQHLDFISSQKRWEAEKARQAPELEHDFLDEDILDLSASSQVSYSAPQSEQEMEEADHILAQEEHELQQLIASMEEDQGILETASQHYGSDDEDYDRIFMEYTTTSENEQRPQYTNADCQDADDMDMSDG